MRLSFLLPAALLTGLSACGPVIAGPSPAAETAAPAAALEPAVSVSAGPAPACTAFTSKSPLERGNGTFTVEAAAFGDTCDTAGVALILRDAAGEPVYSFAGTADRLLGFETVNDPAALAEALTNWAAEPAGSSYVSTSELPEWAAGADYPVSGDFPFYVEEGMTRADYEEIRASARPMFCHVQGKESLVCLDLSDMFAARIGVQALPG